MLQPHALVRAELHTSKGSVETGRFVVRAGHYKDFPRPTITWTALNPERSFAACDKRLLTEAERDVACASPAA